MFYTLYRQKFYLRLIVWQTQARLVDGGMSIVAANNTIMTITGASTLTGVINKLIEFKKVYKRHLSTANG
jgi:hypothetical protein